MVRHGSWCFMVVHHSSSWFVMFCHGSWCFVVVRHGSWCFVMVSWCFIMVHVLSWFAMFRHGSWCFVMVHVLSWFVIFCHGSWCFIMVQYIPDNFKIGVVSLMSQLQLVWWFVMVCDVLWCFVMVHHGSRDGLWCFSVMVSSWFVMVRDVLLSWFVMVHVMVRDVSLSWFHHGSWCLTVMVRHGSWCFIMVQYIPDNFKIGVVSLMSQLQLVWWFVMVHVMVCDVSLSWFHHGSSWFVMFYCHGSVMVRHGSRDGSWCFSVMVSSWFVMSYCHGSSWFVMFYSLKFSRKGSFDPLFSQSEFQIHYQISFLMRLLIFPFPFKEHTSKELC